MTENNVETKALTRTLIGTVTSVLGHYIGSGLAIKSGSKIVKPTVVIVLILLAVKVIQGLITG